MSQGGRRGGGDSVSPLLNDLNDPLSFRNLKAMPLKGGNQAFRFRPLYDSRIRSNLIAQYAPTGEEPPVLPQPKEGDECGQRETSIMRCIEKLVYMLRRNNQRVGTAPNLGPLGDDEISRLETVIGREEPEHCYQTLHFAIPRSMFRQPCAFQGVSRSTQSQFAMWTLFLTFCSALSAIELGSNIDGTESNAEYLRPSNLSSRAFEQISVPKARVYIEYITSSKHNAKQHVSASDPELDEKFLLDNFAGVIIRVYITDPTFWAGAAFNYQVWRGKAERGDLHYTELQTKKQWIRLICSKPSIIRMYRQNVHKLRQENVISSNITDDQIYEAIQSVDDDISPPEDQVDDDGPGDVTMAGGHGSRTYLSEYSEEDRRSLRAIRARFIDAILAFGSQPLTSVTRMMSENLATLDFPVGRTLRDNVSQLREMNRASQALEQARQDMLAGNLDGDQSQQNNGRRGKSKAHSNSRSALFIRKDELRETAARKRAADEFDIRGVASSRDVLNYHRMRVTSVHALVQLFALYTNDTSLLREHGISRDDYNLSDEHSPLNPVRIFSFENACRIIQRDLRVNAIMVNKDRLVPWFEQMNADAYFDKQIGSYLCPDPELMVEIDMRTLNPTELFKYYLPFYRSPHENLLRCIESDPEKYGLVSSAVRSESAVLDEHDVSGAFLAPVASTFAEPVAAAGNARTVHKISLHPDSDIELANRHAMATFRSKQPARKWTVPGATPMVTEPLAVEDRALALLEKMKNESARFSDCMPVDTSGGNSDRLFEDVTQKLGDEFMSNFHDPRKITNATTQIVKIDSQLSHEIMRMIALSERTFALLRRIRNRAASNTISRSASNKLYELERKLLVSFRAEALRVFQISYSPDNASQATTAHRAALMQLYAKPNDAAHKHQWWASYCLHGNLSMFANQRANRILAFEVLRISYNMHTLTAMLLENASVDSFGFRVDNGLHMTLVGPASTGKSFMASIVIEMLPCGMGHVIDTSSMHSFHTAEIADHKVFVKDEGETSMSVGRKALTSDGAKGLEMKKSLLANRRARAMRYIVDPDTGQSRVQHTDTSASITQINLHNFLHMEDEASMLSRFHLLWVTMIDQRPDLTVVDYTTSYSSVQVQDARNRYYEHMRDRIALVHRITQGSYLGLLPACSESSSYLAIFVSRFVDVVRRYIRSNPPSRAVNRILRFGVTNTAAYARDVCFDGELSPFIDRVHVGVNQIKFANITPYQESHIGQTGPYLFSTHDICVFAASQGFREWVNLDVVRVAQFAARFVCKFDERYFRDIYRDARRCGALLMPSWENVWKERNPEEARKLANDHKARKYAARATEPSILAEYRRMIHEMRYAAYRHGAESSYEDRFTIKFATCKPDARLVAKRLAATFEKMNSGVTDATGDRRPDSKTAAETTTTPQEAEALAAAHNDTLNKMQKPSSVPPSNQTTNRLKGHVPAVSSANAAGAPPTRQTTLHEHATGTQPATEEHRTRPETRYAYDPMFVRYSGDLTAFAHAFANSFQNFGARDVTVIKNQLETLSRTWIEAPVIAPIDSPFDKLEFVRNEAAAGTDTIQYLMTRVRVFRMMPQGAVDGESGPCILISTHWLMYNFPALMCEALAATECKTTRKETTIIDYPHMYRPYLYHTFDVRPKPETEMPVTRKDLYVTAMLQAVYARHMRGGEDDEFDESDYIGAAASEESVDGGGVPTADEQEEEERRIQAQKIAEFKKVALVAEHQLSTAPETAKTADPDAPAKSFSQETARIARAIRTNSERIDPMDGPYNAMMLPNNFDKPVRLSPQEEARMASMAPDERMYCEFYANNYGTLAAKTVTEEPSFPGNARKRSIEVLKMAVDTAKMYKSNNDTDINNDAYPRVFISQCDARATAQMNEAPTGSRVAVDSCAEARTEAERTALDQKFSKQYKLFQTYFDRQRNPGGISGMAAAPEGAPRPQPPPPAPPGAPMSAEKQVQQKIAAISAQAIREIRGSNDVRVAAPSTITPVPPHPPASKPKPKAAPAAKPAYSGGQNRWSKK